MKIFEAIHNIMMELDPIAKDKKNQTQGFMYRGVDMVMNVLQPLLVKYKVFIVPQVLEQVREERTTGKGGNLCYSILRVKYIFYAEDGSSVEAIVEGEGMDSGDKASNKAMSVAFKYACFQVFCIPTEEMKDPDGETPPPSVPAVVEICEECGQLIESYEGANGRPVSVEKHIAKTQEKFGKKMCIDCTMKAMQEPC